MRLSVDHVTGFEYASPVRASYNEARLTPLTSARQSVWSSRVTIDPSPWSYTYTDYWGSQVTAFELHDQHRTLSVQGFSVVETRDPEHDWAHSPQVFSDEYDFARLHSDALMDRHAELLVNADRTRPPTELAARTRQLAAASDPRQTVLDVCEVISDHLEYQGGSTQVQSTAAEAWQGGRGVCQDFAHLAIGALRTVGIPSRYVSGYLHPRGTTAEIGSEVEGESHAWFEFWCGQWYAYDPSSRRVPGEAYVRIGHGRDYLDVAPLRGTYAGGESEMFVTVTLTRLG
ncbi:transglutaminase family protein [Propionibacteriaceae bacterium Y2011]|uniref:transglutaminase family protein n=1 Tax=Microlunatus sp. Y2014 TaxID=3418488 RepID=UPI003B4D1F86